MAHEKKLLIKLCSINIGGWSEKSKFFIDKYVNSEGFDALFVQETLTDDLSYLELHNMSAICDTNKAANRGVALYVKEKHSITKLDSISNLSKNIDSCWGLLVIAKKRFIVGNVYAKRNYKPAINEICNMLQAAEEMQKKAQGHGDNTFWRFECSSLYLGR